MIGSVGVVLAAQAIAGGWAISSWTAPHNGEKQRAIFSADNVVVHGDITYLKLAQRIENGKVLSIGSEIMSTKRYGYGTFTVELQSSATTSGKPVSGSITGLGLYASRSETEIDIEVEGSKPGFLQTTTWINETTREAKKIAVKVDPHLKFHTYQIKWSKGSVDFYQDGKLISTHKNVVPTRQAFLFVNHWGTNSGEWGGLATLGVDRFVLIKSVTFEPE